ncbi:MAG: MipA/OmpV family protein [Desulfobacterales bacterium]
MTEKLKTTISKLCKTGIPPVICLLLAWNAPVQADHDPPLWELGLGGAVVTMPAYRGSQNQEVYLAPIPYVIYRGDFLKIDREGIRGMIYDSARLEVDLSADGAIPSASNEGDVREGMPDLDAVGEIGPSINYLIHEGQGTKLQFRLPVRAVFTTDFTSIDHEGWKAHPQINLGVLDVLGHWDAGLSLGPVFADRKYHAYYYEVKPVHATDTRPAYRAEPGYSGTSVQIAASRNFGRLWFGMFARYDNLAGAVFSESPLVETNHSFMGGLGAAWMLGASSQSISDGH